MFAPSLGLKIRFRSTLINRVANSEVRKASRNEEVYEDTPHLGSEQMGSLITNRLLQEIY